MVNHDDPAGGHTGPPLQIPVIRKNNTKHGTSTEYVGADLRVRPQSQNIITYKFPQNLTES